MFCEYCGDILSQNDRHFCGNCEQIQIQRRNQALKKINEYLQIQDHIFSIGINVSFLYKPSQSQPNRDKKITKQQRDLKLNELLKSVTALRNSNSGAVLVHLVGIVEEESYLGAFDEFADESLNAIIHDGKLFADVYKKQRLNAQDDFKEFYDFLLLFVTGEPYLTTFNFNTKISLDYCLKDATELNVRHIFIEKKELGASFHDLGEVVTVAQDLLSTTEHNSLQFKSNFVSEKSESDIVDALFCELKLARYVSAFSKNEQGGSFVFGLTEVKKATTAYQTKVYTLQFLRRSQYESLKPMIEQKARDSVLVCDYDGHSLEIDNIVEVRFVPGQNYQESLADDLGVLQISVRPVCGIVFFNRDGPQAFRYDEETGSITQIGLEDWFDRFVGHNMEVD